MHSKKLIYVTPKKYLLPKWLLNSWLMSILKKIPNPFGKKGGAEHQENENEQQTD
jgi:hypothetical protein